MRSIEFINEIAGLNVAIGGSKLRQYFKPNIIKVSSPHTQKEVVMDSEFLAAAVTWGMNITQKPFDGVSSVAWLGMAADRNVMYNFFSEAGAQMQTTIKVKGIKGMWGEYEPTINILRDPAGRYVVLGRAMMEYLADKDPTTRSVLGSKTAVHEFMHRGLGMVSRYKDINKFCKGVSSRPFKQPWSRWGQTAAHGVDTVNSMRKYQHQYGTVEHMMLYGNLGDDFLYLDDKPGYGHRAWYDIPGMKEEFPEYEQNSRAATKKAMTIAAANLKNIGLGIDAWLSNFAKVKAGVSDDELALMLVNWGRKKIPSIRKVVQILKDKDFTDQK